MSLRLTNGSSNRVAHMCRGELRSSAFFGKTPLSLSDCGQNLEGSCGTGSAWSSLERALLTSFYDADELAFDGAYGIVIGTRPQQCSLAVRDTGYSRVPSLFHCVWANSVFWSSPRTSIKIRPNQFFPRPSPPSPQNASLLVRSTSFAFSVDNSSSRNSSC